MGILEFTLVVTWRVLYMGVLIGGFKTAKCLSYPLKPQLLNNTNLAKSSIFSKYLKCIGRKDHFFGKVAQLLFSIKRKIAHIDQKF